MAKKHAPDGGYLFAAKEIEYRRRQGIAIDQLVTTPRRFRRVAYLDTADAGETRRLLDGGYDPRLLHAVNRSPAEVAWITMRVQKDYGVKVNTHGADLVDVVRRLKDSGQAPDVVILDSTSYLTSAFGDEIRALVAELNLPCALTVTIFAGREKEFIFDNELLGGHRTMRTSFGEETNASHCLRQEWVLSYVGHPDFETCRVHIKDAKWHVYSSSSGRRMLWVAMRLGPHVNLTAGQPKALRLARTPACVMRSKAPDAVKEMFESMARLRSIVDQERQIEKDYVNDKRIMERRIAAIYNGEPRPDEETSYEARKS
jgi:hypothetical protein